MPFFYFLFATGRELWLATPLKMREKVDSSYLIRTVTITLQKQLVRARLIQALDSFHQWEREHSRPMNWSVASACTLRGEVGGHCLILIKRARLIVFGNPVCHGRYVEESLWPGLPYGPACCLPIEAPTPTHALHTWTGSQGLVDQGVGPLDPIQYPPIPPLPSQFHKQAF